MKAIVTLSHGAPTAVSFEGTPTGTSLSQLKAHFTDLAERRGVKLQEPPWKVKKWPIPGEICLMATGCWGSKRGAMQVIFTPN